MADNSLTCEAPQTTTDAFLKGLPNRIPEVTIFFWIIKVLSTTVGETASDFMSVSLGLGLTGTSAVIGACLAIVLLLQFRTHRYVPIVYWSVVVLVSIFGTLITDLLTDNLGVPLEVSTIVFSVALVATFAVWYARERTLSIRSIVTRRREAFYWLAILFTFALGTASGDLMAESLGLGYLVTGILVCAAIVAIAIAWRLGLDSLLAFWLAYILTRPLGASLGDYLSQTRAAGGLGVGPTVTTVAFVAAILAVVAYLTITHRDTIGRPSAGSALDVRGPGVAWQVAVVLVLIVSASGAGYYWRTGVLLDQAAAGASPDAPLGDLSAFRSIAEDTLGLVHAGDLSHAKTRVGDLESLWDDSEARLRRMNRDKWTDVDDAIDDVLANLRAVRQDAATCGASLDSLIVLIDTLDHGPANTQHAVLGG